MDSASLLALNPIGSMKTLFHFKNGTPRQSSLCENARGVLTIDKTVFNNPEHSLDGLQDFSHAWIIFVFHKNNNPHKKAKVKPPRLNGQRVGVFSTRSPYRPNNIGLSLAKIDKIQGASIHFSGIDILDGTPVVDIKPYIPEYDRPVSALTSFPTGYLTSDSQSANYTSTEIICNFSSTERSSEGLGEDGKKNDENNFVDSEKRPADVMEVSSKSLTSSLLQNDSNSNIRESGIDSLSNTLETAPDSMEEGFYSLSAALDRAGTALRQSVQSHGSTDFENKSSISPEICNSGQSELDEQVLEASCQDNKPLDDEDCILNSMVGDVISKAALDVLWAADMKEDEMERTLTSSQPKQNQQSCDSDQRQAMNNSYMTENKTSVIAPWLSNPPVSKISVTFSTDAVQELQAFHSKAEDPRFRLEMLSGPADAKEALTSILHEEPRSVYRRQKCQNSVYYFAVDVLHVTCWFDGDAVTVIRIKPVADVPQLQDGNILSYDNDNVKEKNNRKTYNT